MNDWETIVTVINEMDLRSYFLNLSVCKTCVYKTTSELIMFNKGAQTFMKISTNS